MKANKLTKATIIFLFFVPIVMLTTCVVQTFVLKGKKANLEGVQSTVTAKEKELENYGEIKDYYSSSKYLEDYNSYELNKGDNGDYVIVID